MASEIKTNTISNAAGTGPANLTGQEASKATCQWDQAASHAIQNSSNISSVTDTSAGNATLALTSSMSDSLFVVAGSNGNSTSDPSDGSMAISTASTSSILTECFAATGHTLVDRTFNSFLAQGDLA